MLGSSEDAPTVTQAPDRAAAAAALADRIAALSASATGADDMVTVTVAGSGNVTALALSDRVREMTGAELSVTILRTIGRAQAALADGVAEAVSETVGSDSETGRAVLDGFSTRFPAVPEIAPATPRMPAPKAFPSFASTPSLPHQAPGGGYESGRDSRAR